MVENYVTDVHDFVEQAPLENIEKYIKELQSTIKTLRQSKQTSQYSPQGAFKKSKFAGQYDR